MGTYVPDTKQEQQEMLREIGFNKIGRASCRERV